MASENMPSSPVRILSEYASKLGIECSHTGNDWAVYTMAYRPDNTTIADLVHGGALLSLADCAITGAAWSVVKDLNSYRGVTTDLSLSFLRGARSMDLIADAKVIRRGKTLCFCRVEIRSTDGQLVADGKATYKLTQIETPGQRRGERADAGADV